MTRFVKFWCFGWACFAMYAAITTASVSNLIGAIVLMLFYYIARIKQQKEQALRKAAEKFVEDHAEEISERLAEFQKNFEEGKKEYEEIINGKKDKKDSE